MTTEDFQKAQHCMVQINELEAMRTDLANRLQDMFTEFRVEHSKSAEFLSEAEQYVISHCEILFNPMIREQADKFNEI